MKIAFYIKKLSLQDDPGILSTLRALEDEGICLYELTGAPQEGTDMILVFGGDGSFLSAAAIAAPCGVPVLGVNLGRVGFLSENRLGDIVSPIVSGEYGVEERGMLQVHLDGPVPERFCPWALNEVALHRNCAGTIGIDVNLGAESLPTYWADGLLVSTATGSTAYSLSVGGPICTPSLNAHILAPVSPHNLNVRPIVVPDDVPIRFGVHNDRKPRPARLSLDNRDYLLDASSVVSVLKAPFPMKRVVLGKAGFIRALREKLFWGEDVRNN